MVDNYIFLSYYIVTINSSDAGTEYSSFGGQYHDVPNADGMALAV